MENKRGITLASNIGKLSERIINKRVTKILPFTEGQAGGRKVDQLETNSRSVRISGEKEEIVHYIY